MQAKYSNKLAGEASLYLQQHAYNPVNWYSWSEEAWNKAKNEDKLVLISIGYSSCHWCHVMEHESFMDESVAEIMNEYYVCIKVDREERPDIDMVYMNAVQLMTGAGGWPLNCFALPDKRPVYGGTYFPKPAWKDLLIKLNEFYKTDRDKAEQYADELSAGINRPELPVASNLNTEFTPQMLQIAIDGWKKSVDSIEGGPGRVPKFPLPNNYSFLLRYSVATNDSALLDHVKLTLKKIAYGGIYDQVGGGFSRYSTDALWKIPHFEKMLYDNAQLITLYSSAYKLTKDELYKNVVSETLKFLIEEMSDGNGGFYSSFDADSEGEEGKFYVWTKDEVQKIAGKLNHPESFKILSEYFNVNDIGLWEKNNYILLRKKDDNEIAKAFNISVDDLRSFIHNAKSHFKEDRNKRIPPSLDKKIITSWNALMITALTTSFQAFNNDEYYAQALKCANRLLNNSFDKNDRLMHISSSQNSNPGYLEDYAFVISAFINVYQITFDETWLQRARKLCDEAIKYFYDESDGLFWFTSSENTDVISRKKEIYDNVISSSNSEMANALFLLGDYFSDEKYASIARRMVASANEFIIRYPTSFSNWANVFMNYSNGFLEIAITGKKADEYSKQLSSNYLPNVLFAGKMGNNSSIPLLKNRYTEGETKIYVCSNHSCKLPVNSVEEALNTIGKELKYPLQNVN